MKRVWALLLTLALVLGCAGAWGESADPTEKNTESADVVFEEANGTEASNASGTEATPTEKANADAANSKYYLESVQHPSQVNLHVIGTQVTVKWKAVPGVDFYDVWDQYPADGGTRKYMGRTTKTSLTIQSSTGNHKFLVASGIYVGGDEWISYWSRYRILNITNTLQPPPTLKASVSGTKVTLSWTRSSGAKKFFIKEKGSNGVYKQIASTSKQKYTLTLSKGQHRIGVSSAYNVTSGVVVESDYIRYVDITIKKGTSTSPSTGKAKYYALLIGEATFSNEYASRNEYDVKNMATMLKSKVNGPTGAAWKVTQKINAGYTGTKNLINSTFKNATKNDVCLFFIATHGNSSGDGELAMNYYSDRSFLDFDTLATWLKNACKGKVIVVIESCGAGSAVYAPGVVQNDASAAGETFGDEMSAVTEKSNAKLIMNQPGPDDFDAANFVNRAISAFAKADPGIELDEEMDGEEVNVGAGAMRTSKFYVLAAARHHELSWGTETYGAQGNYFTKWLIEGVGSKSYSPADTNRNKIVTLNEAFLYLKKHSTTPGGNVQHAQVYPKNSSYKLFKLK